MEKIRSGFCKKCGAWYGQLGLEPSLDMYIEHLLEIMRELKRVLKKTGVIFWVHGDCYGGSGCGKGDYRNNNKRSLSNPKLYCEKPNPQLTLTPKCIALQNFRFILRCVDELGLILRDIIIWAKKIWIAKENTTTGNAMPSSVRDRCTFTYEPVFMLVKAKEYFFDQDALRVPYTRPLNRWGGDELKAEGKSEWDSETGQQTYRDRNMRPNIMGANRPNVWQINTEPLKLSHFAPFPSLLVENLIKAGCPQWICRACGKARERIVKVRINEDKVPDKWKRTYRGKVELSNSPTQRSVSELYKEALSKERYTIGWTDCGCGAGWVSGVVLDPFAGSGTVGVVAERLGRNSILIDLNKEYCEMALKRLKPLVAQKKLTGEESIIETEGF